MSDFIVHGIPGSPYVRSALLALEEKGLPYTIAAMPFGGHKTPEYRAINPFARIPTMDHGDFRLYETQAILRYLDRIAPNPSMTPTDPRQEARMNQIVGISDCYVFPDISACIAFFRLFAPRFGMPVDEGRIADALPRAQVCIDEIARLMGTQQFMAGEALSIADLTIVPHLSYFGQTEEGRTMMGPHPNLMGWLGRMNARPSMIKTTAERLMVAG